jgi:TorA maturation chaperone TorD
MSTLDFTPGQVARARHHTYALLGRLFVDGLNDELLPYVHAIPELVSTLPDSLDVDEAAADYQHLFCFNLFPYESIFLDTTGLLGGAISEAVWRNYERAGYSVNKAATSADHIGPELSFMAFLAGAEAEAWEDGQAAVAQQMQQQQRDFLQAHLLRWLPPLALAVRRQGQLFFTALADLTLAFVHSHYASMGSRAAIDFRLPAPPTLLDDEKTGLKEIAAYLATPLYSGFYLSRDDVGRMGRQQRLPRGFAGRSQMLLNLMRAAVQYDALPALLAELQSLTDGWQKAYAVLAGTYPELRPWATTWQARANNTVHILSGITSQYGVAA